MSRAMIEQQIRELLVRDDISPQTLSSVLFGVQGLFQRLATTEQERQQVTKSQLFQDANARLTELQKLEVADMEEAHERRDAAKSKGDGLKPSAAPASSDPSPTSSTSASRP